MDIVPSMARLDMNRTRGLFLRFLFSYVGMLLTAVAVGTAVYIAVGLAGNKDAVERGSTFAEQVLSRFESAMDEIDRFVVTLAWNPRVGRFAQIDKPLDVDDSYKILDVRQYVADFKAAHPFIRTFFLYFAATGVMLSPDLTISNLPFSYGKYVSLGGFDYAGWKSFMVGSPHWKEFLPGMPFLLNGSPVSDLGYIFTLPLGERAVPTAALLVLLDSAAIGEWATRDIRTSPSAFQIVDAGGAVIVSGGREAALPLKGIDGGTDAKGATRWKLGAHEYIVAYKSSAVRPIRCIAAIPYATLAAFQETIGGIFFFAFPAVIVIGVAMAYFLARSSMRPVAKSLALLARTVERNKPIVAESCFRRLLQGEFGSAEELRAHMDSFGMTVPDGRYIVLLAKIGGMTGHIGKEIISEIILLRRFVRAKADGIAGLLACCDIDADKLALVVRLTAEENADDRTRLEEFARDVKTLIRREFHVGMSVTAGSRCENLLDLCLSCEEAGFASAIKSSDADAIGWYEDVPKKRGTFFYPLAIESRLMRSLREGDAQNAVRLIDRVVESNRPLGGLAGDQGILLFNELQATIAKAGGRDGASTGECPELRGWDSFADLDEVTAYLHLECRRVAEANLGAKKGYARTLSEEMVRYIDGHFADALTLACIAKRFNLSEVYVSKFFKQSTGLNFAEYLEGVRMNRARTLLAEARLPVTVIARKSGYRSSNTFRRAFRRLYGQGPKDYALGVLAVRATTGEAGAVSPKGA